MGTNHLFCLALYLIRWWRLLKSLLAASFPLQGHCLLIIRTGIHGEQWQERLLTLNKSISSKQLFLSVTMRHISSSLLQSLSGVWTFKRIEDSLSLLFPVLPLCVGVRRGWDHSVHSTAPTDSWLTGFELTSVGLKYTPEGNCQKQPLFIHSFTK